MTLKKYKKITLLHHAGAGSGEAAKVTTQVIAGLRYHFSHGRLEIVESLNSEHLAEIGRTSQADLIVCLTGDGSVHHLAQTLLERPQNERPTIAVIPAGSGNDFAKSLGMPEKPKNALAALPYSVPARVDVGKVNDTYFLETLSFGVDAAIALNTEELRQKTKTRGVRLYTRAALSAIMNELTCHKVNVRLADREFTTNALILAVQNGPTYGSGYIVAPRASLTDGLLDVCIATDIGKLTALYYLSKMKNGNHEDLKGISHFTVESMQLEFEEQLPIQCDGEKLLGTQFAISIIPDALDVLTVPDTFDGKKARRQEREQAFKAAGGQKDEPAVEVVVEQGKKDTTEDANEKSE